MADLHWLREKRWDAVTDVLTFLRATPYETAYDYTQAVKSNPKLRNPSLDAALEHYQSIEKEIKDAQATAD